MLGSGGTGKSHLAQAIGQAAILQGHKELYRQTHILLEEVTEATIEGRRTAVGAMLDRLLDHGHVLKCGPRSWRTKTAVTN